MPDPDKVLLPTDRLAMFDFATHNAEVAAMWKAYNARTPYRIPIILGTNTRYFMFTPEANPRNVDFQAYSESPDVMFDTQLRFQRWSRTNLLQDSELGPPKEWWIGPDFQNYYEAAWFGCAIHYMDGQVPDTHPEFAEAPERVMAHGLPDPFSRTYARALDYHQHYRQRAAQENYLGLPIRINQYNCGLSTDGPMTVACNLFSPEFVCEAMIAEPERLERLLAFITTATIARILAWRKFFDLPLRPDNYGFADDSIAMISTAMYREHILPHHRRMFDELSGHGARSIHLCGDSTRHFLTLRDELNIRSFDTGFPVDFGKLRRELGPDVIIQGGPHIGFLMAATPQQVRDEVQRILFSGILEGGMMLLREGNNLPPGTPLPNTEAMYHAGREFGRITHSNSPTKG